MSVQCGSGEWVFSVLEQAALRVAVCPGLWPGLLLVLRVVRLVPCVIRHCQPAGVHHRALEGKPFYA